MAGQFRQLADALDRLARDAREDSPARGNPLEQVVASLAEIVEILQRGEREGSVPVFEIHRIGEHFGEISRVLRELGEARSS